MSSPEFVKECCINNRRQQGRKDILLRKPNLGAKTMKPVALMCFLIMLTVFARGQKTLPPLKDGVVIDEKTDFRHDGALLISGHVKLKGISLDLRGPVTVSAGAELELDDVKLKVSDPPTAPNGTSGLRCEGPAKITIRKSTMTAEGSAHPIWWLQGEVAVDDFQTRNSEFHLDHVRAKLENFVIFELEISRASEVVGRHLRLVFLSTHTGKDDKIEFSDIPSDRSFSQSLHMGSLARADLTDTVAQLFLVYVHGSSDVTLNHIGRAQLAIAPTCRGTLSLPHGRVGTANAPVLVPEPGASNCTFRLRLNDVNADTWDVYAGDGADLTLTNSVIDELTADGHAKVTVRDSDIFADWLSLGGDSQLTVKHSTVGAGRLAAQRPDLATSQIRVNGRSRATFDDVKFDCGIVAGGTSTILIRHPVISPAYIRKSERATVETDLPVETLGGKESEQ